MNGGAYSTVIGRSANIATSSYSTAIGYGASVTDHDNTVAIGDSSASLILGGDYAPIGRLNIKATSTASTGYALAIMDSSSSNLLRLTNAGFLGIGNTSPEARLHVVASSLGSGANTAQLAAGGFDSFIHYGTTGDWYIRSSSGSGKVILQDTGGNVGIGTTTPGTKLDVYGGAIRLMNTGNPYFELSDVGASAATTYLQIADSVNDNFQIYHGGASRLDVTTSGNVGIGDTGPDAKLEVKLGASETDLFIGSASSDVPRFMVDLDAVGTGGARLRMFNSVNTQTVAISAGSAATFFTGSGAFGIGTTSPSAKFSVKQSAQTALGGFWLGTSDDTDFRSQFLDTSGVLSFYGGDTAGTLNTATLNAAGEWTNASDRAYKDDIDDLSYGLDALMALQPRSYVIKNTDDRRVGFIAQEVEPVIPEIVSGKDGSKGISYGNLVAVVVKAVQQIASISGAFKTALVAWLADAGNGIGALFADDIHASDRLCVGATCVTPEQFAAMLAATSQSTAAPSPSSSSGSGSRVDTIGTEPPVMDTTTTVATTTSQATSTVAQPATPEDAASDEPTTADDPTDTPEAAPPPTPAGEETGHSTAAEAETTTEPAPAEATPSP
jgi:hypothetical protein